MNGKDYVVGARELAERIISEIKESGTLEADPVLEGAAKACADLGRLKNKATLRTKNGTNLAFPVMDAAKNLEEAWEEAREQEDPEELKEQLETFVNTAAILDASLKERTVIMT